MSRPRRIDGFSYFGPHRYFLTFCTRSRARIFTDPAIVSETVEQIRRTSQDERFALLAYCVMPDHVHLLVEGSSETSDLRRFVKLAKQRSGAQHALKHGGALWQEGYHDRVLRAEDDMRLIARYILENPVRAGLVQHATEYAFSGSDLWTMADLVESLR